MFAALNHAFYLLFKCKWWMCLRQKQAALTSYCWSASPVLHSYNFPVVCRSEATGPYHSRRCSPQLSFHLMDPGLLQSCCVWAEHTQTHQIEFMSKEADKRKQHMRQVNMQEIQQQLFSTLQHIRYRLDAPDQCLNWDSTICQGGRWKIFH